MVLPLGAFSQSDKDTVVVQSFRIYYPINEIQLHENYNGNASALKLIQRHFSKSPSIDSIVIYSYASPDGPTSFNKYLAEERGKLARKYIIDHLPAEINFPDSLIVLSPVAENWEGLYEMVQEHYPYSDKEEVLELLSSTKVTLPIKKEMLKKLNGRRPWRFIRDEILPNLRYATWVARWVPVLPEADTIPVVPETPHLITVLPMPPADTIEYEPIPEMVEEKKVILALKSNLLYDVLSFLNFSIEVPIYKDKFSVLYYHQFPWWRWGESNNEYCVRFLSIGGEGRWWFKTKERLNGHFLGVYAESGKYDFERQRSICYQGEFYSAGLSYGFAMPIGRALNLEFSLSAGYASVPYRGYNPSEDYGILWRDQSRTGNLHYFGPTKAQISLVVPIKVKSRGGNAL